LREKKMKFKQYINEEWFNTYKIEGKTVEVFYNPSSDEPKKNSKEIRGVIDKKGDLFAWDGDDKDSPIHEPVMKRLNKSHVNGAISVFLYPKRGLVEVSFFDFNQVELTQQEVDRYKDIVKENQNVIKYMGKKFKIRASNTMFE
jgi:hypothetical protein